MLKPHPAIEAYLPPLRSANTPTLGLGWGKPFKENKRKIPRTIKRNMFAECLFLIANWTFSKILTWRPQPGRPPRPWSLLVISPFLCWMLNRCLDFSPSRLGLALLPGPCLWIWVPSYSHWAKLLFQSPSSAPHGLFLLGCCSQPHLRLGFPALNQHIFLCFHSRPSWFGLE